MNAEESQQRAENKRKRDVCALFVLFTLFFFS
jgi:hypothetical protein